MLFSAAAWVWLALAVAVIACSSGGVWFSLLHESPAILRAGWRLCMTALLQFPFFVRDALSATRDEWINFVSTIPWISVAGFALAVHFACWSLSINYTSLAHSLLFVTTTPLLLVVFRFGEFVLYRCLVEEIKTRRLPPTWMEALGTLVGSAAAAVLALEGSSLGNYSSGRVSLVGDLVAILGAAAMGVYLSLGAHVRASVSLWLYVFPVTLISGLVCVIVSLLGEEDVRLDGLEANSVFGLFGSPHRLLLVLGAAGTAGILGHTLANLTLQNLSPLTVSIALLGEPIVGSLLGFLCGVQPKPSTLTVLCGLPLVLAAVLVTLGDRKAAWYQGYDQVNEGEKGVESVRGAPA